MPSLEDFGVSYDEYHKERYAYLIKRMKGYNPKSIVLIAPKHEYQLIRDAFPDAEILSIGLDDATDNPWHVYLDINNVADMTWYGRTDFDLVVACEIIEHLHIPPKTFVDFCLHLGKRVIISTPNAHCSYYRYAVLFGIQSIWELVKRDERDTMGHVWEYTIKDVKSWGKVESLTVKNYFGVWKNDFPHHLFKQLGKLFPQSWRDGIFAVFTR